MSYQKSIFYYLSMPTKETFQGIWLNASGFNGYVPLVMVVHQAFRIASRLILFLWVW